MFRAAVGISELSDVFRGPSTILVLEMLVLPEFREESEENMQALHD